MGNKRAVAGPRNITEYGNSMLLHEMLKDIKPRLKEVFPDHREEFTPIDLLFKYSKVYHLEMRERAMITEVPKKMRDLDEALGLYMFPKMIRS